MANAILWRHDLRSISERTGQGTQDRGRGRTGDVSMSGIFPDIDTSPVLPSPNKKEPEFSFRSLRKGGCQELLLTHIYEKVFLDVFVFLWFHYK